MSSLGLTERIPNGSKKQPLIFQLRIFNGERFRDWGILKYLFRSIDRYLPWINQIYLITDNQVPVWLDSSNSHVQVIDHREIIDHQFLPTFNSNAILMNAYKIPNLSEHFMIIEDDMLFTCPAKPEDFFINGQPRDFLIESPISPNEDFAYILMNTMMLINRQFDKRKVLKQLRSKYLIFIMELNRSFIGKLLLSALHWLLQPALCPTVSKIWV